MQKYIWPAGLDVLDYVPRLYYIKEMLIFRPIGFNCNNEFMYSQKTQEFQTGTLDLNAGF